MNVIRRLSIAAATAVVAATALLGTPKPVQAQTPTWLNSAVIYAVNPEIFSTAGFNGITSQLTRLQSLGVNVIWIMPLYPRGAAINGHPNFNSPYCIKDYTTVNPNFGTTADLTNLITTAHGKGMKVILDAVLNHTSWDNALITSHPEYYVHTDGNSSNSASIAAVNGLSDVAQLNYANTGLQSYITTMLQNWIVNYNVDGFRFDMADNPVGTGRLIPQSFWNSLRTNLQSKKADILMLGEEEDVQLALSPFEVDYGFNMYNYGVVAAIKTANNASTLSYQWQWPYTISNPPPAGMKQMNYSDQWDVDRDIVILGGYPQAMAAAAWDFTISGIPLLYNGQEAANTNGGVNPHTQVNWTGTNSAAFSTFYTQILALRNGSGGALQQGTTTFVTPSSAAVIAYSRTGGGQTYFVEINTNGGAASGTLPAQSGSWTDVTPTGAPGGKTHTLPSTGNFSLSGYDFAIFKIGGATAPSTPTGLSATSGNAQVALSWSSASGATSYNVYRSTTSGGEGTTAIASGITGTSYNNTGLTNGTQYFYKVAAVNSVGTSGQSSEVSATPIAPTAPAAPTGLVASAGNASVSLSWTASSGATSYNAYRSTTAGGEGTTAIATGITGTSYNNTGLTNGTKYYYKVAAVNSVGTSAQSSEVSATPSVPTEGPYGGTAAAVPGTVQFENYDTGGEGVAYHDTEAANQGGQYRTTDGVDIEACTDAGGGYDVGWTQPGEYMKYTVNAAVSGTYTIGFRVASGSTGGTFHVLNAAGTNLSGTVTVPGTGGWQTWTTVNSTVTLSAGTQILKVVIDTGAGAFNLNYMSFSSSTYTGTPYTGTAISLPGTIQVENFDKGGEGVAYHDSETANQGGQYRTTDGVDIEACTDTGGGYDVGWTQGGEWQKYTVNATTAKTYTVTFRIASGFASGTQVAQIHLEDKNGVNLTGVQNVIATGGWQTWTNASASATLPAGSNVVKLVIDGSNGGFNINSFTLN